MSLLYVDSFDHYQTSDLKLKWDQINEPSSGSPTVTIAPTGGRRGGGALLMGLLGGWVKKTLAGSPTTVITGAAIKLSTFGDSTAPLIAFGGTADHVRICTLANGSLVAQRMVSTPAVPQQIGVTSAAAVPTNVFFYLEVKVTISDTGGRVKILVNGATVLDLIDINTLGTGAGTGVGYVKYFNGTLLAMPTTVDDLYICDGNGIRNNDFLGDIRIDVCRPNDDGTYRDFVPDTGTVHYSRVNEAIADTTTSVASAIAGTKDSYQFSDVTLVGGFIKGLQIVNAALKDDSGPRSIANLTRSGTAEVESAVMPLSTDRRLYSTIQETDPATGGSWTPAAVSAAEFGVTVVE